MEGKDQESINRDIYKTRPFEIYIENLLQIGISERRIIYTKIEIVLDNDSSSM